MAQRSGRIGINDLFDGHSSAKESLLQIAIADAKAHFSELIRKAEAGESILITRHGRPVVQLLAAGQAAATPLIGAMKGAFTVPDDLDAPDPETQETFEDGAVDPA